MSIDYRVELKVRRDDMDILHVVRVKADDRQAAIDYATSLVRADGFEIVDAVANIESDEADLWFEWVATRSFFFAPLHIVSRGIKDSSESALCGLSREWKHRQPLVYFAGADGQVAIKPLPVTVVCIRCRDAALDLVRGYGWPRSR